MEETTGATSRAVVSRNNDAPAAIDEAELKRELASTLAARRELGPEYDAQLADAFVAKLTAQLSAQLADMQRQLKRAHPRQAPSHDQRLGLAIVSIVMLIPLAAIVLAGGLGLWGLGLLLLALVAINAGFRFL